MASDDRRDRILAHLRKKETASVEELSVELGVSKMTVHRDLDLLEQRKVLRKIRGGVTLQPSILFEADYAFRSLHSLDEKQALADRAFELVEPGMAVLIDDSSTCFAMIPSLAEKAPLTVITNAVHVMEALRTIEGVTVIILGGRYDPVSNSVLGLVCEQSMSRLRADIGFYSTSTIVGTDCFVHDPDIVRAKHAMMRGCRKNYLLVDSTKFGKSALNLFCGLDAFDRTFITSRIPADALDKLRIASVEHDIVRM